MTLFNKLRPWWIITFKGILLFLLGVWTLINPNHTSSEFTIFPYVGILWFLSGLGFTIISINSRKTNIAWKWTLLEGIIDIIVGLIIFSNAVDSAFFAPYVIGGWALLAGIIAISQSLLIRAHDYSFWGIPFSWGLVSLIVGSLMIFNKPIFTNLGITYITATIMVTSGFYQISISFKLKNLLNTAES